MTAGQLKQRKNIKPYFSVKLHHNFSPFYKHSLVSFEVEFGSNYQYYILHNFKTDKGSKIARVISLEINENQSVFRFQVFVLHLLTYENVFFYWLVVTNAKVREFSGF